MLSLHVAINSLALAFCRQIQAVDSDRGGMMPENSLDFSVWINESQDLL